MANILGTLEKSIEVVVVVAVLVVVVVLVVFVVLRSCCSVFCSINNIN